MLFKTTSSLGLLEIKFLVTTIYCRFFSHQCVKGFISEEDLREFLNKSPRHFEVRMEGKCATILVCIYSVGTWYRL